MTLVVIGIVAALTIPALLQQHREYSWEKAAKVWKIKFDDALHSMNSKGNLSKNETTENFVEKLKEEILMLV